MKEKIRKLYDWADAHYFQGVFVGLCVWLVIDKSPITLGVVFLLSPFAAMEMFFNKINTQIVETLNLMSIAVMSYIKGEVDDESRKA